MADAGLIFAIVLCLFIALVGFPLAQYIQNRLDHSRDKNKADVNSQRTDDYAHRRQHDAILQHTKHGHALPNKKQAIPNQKNQDYIDTTYTEE